MSDRKYYLYMYITYTMYNKPINVCNYCKSLSYRNLCLILIVTEQFPFSNAVPLPFVYYELYYFPRSQ